MSNVYQKIYETGKIRTIKDERKKREINYDNILKERVENKKQIANSLMNITSNIKNNDFKRRIIDPNDSFSLEDQEQSNDKNNITMTVKENIFERLMKKDNKNIEYFKRSSKLNTLERTYFKLLSQREAFNVNDFQLKFNSMKKH